MSDMERKLHEAFDAIALQEDLAKRTLERIEEVRAQEAAQETAQDGAAREKATAPAVTPAVRAAAKRHARRTRRWVRIAVAACLAAALVGGGGVVYASESAYVEISTDGTGSGQQRTSDTSDGASSQAGSSEGAGESAIELGLNCFNIVVRATGMNAAGEALLQDVDVVGKSYEEAANLLLGQEATGDGGFVDVTVSSDNVGQRAYLGQTSESCLGHRASGTYECSHASTEERQAGQEAGIGTARYQAYLALAELDPSFTLEDCEGLTLTEMLWMQDALESGRAASASDARAQAEAAGIGSGHHGEGAGEHAGWGAGQAGNGEGAGSQGAAGQGQASSAGQGGGQGQAFSAGQGAGQGEGQGAAGQGGGAGQGAGNGGGQGHGQGSSAGHEGRQHE